MSNNNNNWQDWCKRNWLYLAGGAAIAGAVTMSSGFNDESGYTNEPGATIDNPNGISYTEMLNDADRRYIQGIAISDNSVISTDRNGHFYIAQVPSGRDAYEDFSKTSVNITQLPKNSNSAAEQSGGGGGGLSMMISLAMLGLLGFWVFRSMKGMSNGGGGGGAMGVGKSKAKMLTTGQIKERFADVAGVDEAKQELMEVIEFLKNPSKFTRLGAKMPKGFLMEGPPGTGKTLLAKATAGEAGVPFLTMSGSDFVEMYVGVGAARVRDTFKQAKDNAPCIIFIDEIDAVGKKRGGGGMSGGNDEREQTLNQILVEMDGFGDNSGIIIMGATNRAELLDDALKRPGRFDRKVTVQNPNVTGREAILKVHAANVPLGSDVDLRLIALGTPGMSGADLANLVNESALIAARWGDRAVNNVHFEAAKDKILLGLENKGMVMSERDRKMTAYHEAGHAVVGAHYYRNGGLCDQPHKATIIPRGGALGLVLSLPDQDEVTYLKNKLESRLIMAMAGRASERIIFGEDFVSNGATGDIQQASNIARMMVTKFGMSELGSVDYGEENNPYKSLVSEDMKQKIDTIVKDMITKAEEKAYELIQEGGELNAQWEHMAQSLLEHETLDRNQIQLVMDLKDPTPPKPEISEEPNPLPLDGDIIHENVAKPNEVVSENDSDADPSAPETSNDNTQEDKPKNPISGIPSVKRKRANDRLSSAPPIDDGPDFGPQ